MEELPVGGRSFIELHHQAKRQARVAAGARAAYFNARPAAHGGRPVIEFRRLEIDATDELDLARPPGAHFQAAVEELRWQSRRLASETAPVTLAH